MSLGYDGQVIGGFPIAVSGVPSPEVAEHCKAHC